MSSQRLLKAFAGLSILATKHIALGQSWRHGFRYWFPTLAKTLKVSGKTVATRMALSDRASTLDFLWVLQPNGAQVRGEVATISR